jgi:hypothetical protein
MVLLLEAAAFLILQKILVHAQHPDTRLKNAIGKDWKGKCSAMGGQKSKGTATYKSVCSGMWTTSDFESDLGGIPYQGHGMDGYDQMK